MKKLKKSTSSVVGQLSSPHVKEDNTPGVALACLSPLYSRELVRENITNDCAVL